MIKIGARESPLSKAQVQEVLHELHAFHPSVIFDPIWVKTTGDLDRQTSLRNLGKTDFFTRELDEMLLQKQIHIAIHSAKDLPEPIPSSLTIAAITKGQDVRDVLVLREKESFTTLPTGALIATSSARREDAVRMLRSDLCFSDLRGTIAERLHLLETQHADGVVVAEAALIRLGLSHLNRIFLPGPTAEGQGRIAILCRNEDQEILELFRCIHAHTLSGN